MNICKNCNQQFTIHSKDKEFYQRIKVPEPTQCPDCRRQRRLAFRNERSLYQRKCDLTKKDMISMYPDSVPWPVFEPTEWHSDKWDDTQYGQDFDFERPFFDQFKELQSKVPRPALAVIEMDNSPYVNQCWKSKSSYMCFDMGFSEKIMYSGAVYHSKDLVDCLFARKCELSYFLIDCVNCYGSRFLQDCNDCHDAFWSYDCKGCSRIAFCYNLRNQKNYIFNKKVTDQEFDDFIKEMREGAYKKYQKYFEDWKEKVIKKAIHKFSHNINAENCTGDYILNSKNCQESFDVDECEDLKYCNRMDEKIYNSYDLSNCSICEMDYECMVMTGNRLKFCSHIWIPSTDCEYCDLIMGCDNCFGCIGLKHKKFNILNKQYSEEEYNKMIPKIIDHMKKTREYGEFFPIELSPYAYNESVVDEFFPLKKEEVIKKGWRWKDEPTGSFNNETIKPNQIPDKISDIKDDILKEVLICEECNKNYKIIPQELDFYRQHGLPIPRTCNYCRHLERMNFRNPMKLWNRECAKCSKKFMTTYAPDRKEIIYCEECYKKEIY